MALNLAKAVVAYLQARPEEKFTARQIAEWVFANFPVECQEKRANSRGDYLKSDADLVQQLGAEISSQRPRMQKKHPALKTTEDYPRKYYYSEKSDSAEVAAAEGEAVSVIVEENAPCLLYTSCHRITIMQRSLVIPQQANGSYLSENLAASVGLLMCMDGVPSYD